MIMHITRSDKLIHSFYMLAYFSNEKKNPKTLENSEEAIENGQSRKIGNIIKGKTRGRTPPPPKKKTKKKTEHNMC